MPDDTDLLFKIIAQDEYKAKLEEARAQVDQMTDAEKQNVIATHQAAEADQELAGATDQAKASGLSWADALTGINQGLEVVNKTVEAAKQVWDFAKEGAAVQRIGEQFRAVAADFGASGDEMVAAMDKAARGTVDDEELMQVATRSMTQGVVTSQDQLVKFTEIARASAVRFGGDTASALQSIMYATEVGAARQLKATIGVVDFTKAYEELAKQLGKRKQDLTDEEQLQARVNAVLTQGETLVRKVGAAGDDTLTSMQRLEVRMADLGDTIKSNVATSVDGLLFGVENLNNLMQAHADEVSKTAKTYTEYQVEVARSGQLTGDLTAVSRMNTDMQGRVIGTYVTLNDQLYSVNHNLQILNKSEWDNLQVTAEEAGRYDEATKFVKNYNEARADQVEKANAAAAAEKALSDQIGTITDRAITYADQTSKLNDLKRQLTDLDNQIIAQGPAHVATVDNAKMSAEQRALAEQKLAVALEDSVNIKRKTNETDAEYALRVSEAKAAVNKLDESLGTHNVTLGGATAEQLKNRDAILANIEALQLQDNKARAMEGVKALEEALKNRTITTEQFTERMTGLNRVTGLYSAEALTAATNQQVLLDKLTDPGATDWYTALTNAHTELNTKYIPAVEKTTSTQETHREKMEKVMNQYDKTQKAVDDYKIKQDVLADDIKNKVNQAHQDHITKLAAETDQMIVSRGEVDKYITRLLAIPKDISTTVRTKYVTEGEPPGGGGAGHQSGINMIIPPNYPNDTYPLGYARSGEQFIVKTTAQQAAEQQTGGSQVNHNETFNLYDTLITRQVAEQRRIENLKSLVGSM